MRQTPGDFAVAIDPGQVFRIRDQRKVHRAPLGRLAGLQQLDVLARCRELFEVLNRLIVGRQLVVGARLESEYRLGRRHCLRGCIERDLAQEEQGDSQSPCFSHHDHSLQFGIISSLSLVREQALIRRTGWNGASIGSVKMPAKFMRRYGFLPPLPGLFCFNPVPGAARFALAPGYYLPAPPGQVFAAGPRRECGWPACHCPSQSLRSKWLLPARAARIGGFGVVERRHSQCHARGFCYSGDTKRAAPRRAPWRGAR